MEIARTGASRPSYTLDMEFRVLGPLEVSSEGRLLDLGGAKQRALLAMLLLDANSVVSTDRLTAGLWEDDPPETAQKALQVHVSGLRKVLGKERVVTKEPGYLLRLEAGELDLARFQRLREQGKPADALALWRGEPLSEFSSSRFARSEIARLEDARLACLEERIDQDIKAGRHNELTGELEGSSSRYPLREQLRALLILALYRCGRQAEALAAYQEARQRTRRRARDRAGQAAARPPPGGAEPGSGARSAGGGSTGARVRAAQSTHDASDRNGHAALRRRRGINAAPLRTRRRPVPGGAHADARARACRIRTTPW